MSLYLTDSDIQQLGKVVEALASPLGYASVDAWRSDVNNLLRELLGADSAGFMLPVREGLYLYSQEHSAEQLSRYPELQPPLLDDGRTIFDATIEKGVSILERTYGGAFQRYCRSEYYNDYAAANGAHDNLAALLPTINGVAGLQFWHAHPTRRKFGEREVALLQLAFPALRAGVHTFLQFQMVGPNVLELIDRLNMPLLVIGANDRQVHVTDCLTRLLNGDPEKNLVIARAAATSAGSFVEHRTVLAVYHIHTFAHDTPATGRVMIASIQPRSPMQKCDLELRATYALTDAEIRVARHIAAGLSNRQVAEALFISPHTAKRHTEKIFRKLNVTSRAQVQSCLHHQV